MRLKLFSYHDYWSVSVHRILNHRGHFPSSISKLPDVFCAALARAHSTILVLRHQLYFSVRRISVECDVTAQRVRRVRLHCTLSPVPGDDRRSMSGVLALLQSVGLARSV
jgi:hypothetical protein